jgi:hypothetical protein
MSPLDVLQMNHERRVSLVNGTHRKVTPIPQEVRKGGYHYRIGLVLDSYRSDCADMYFDSALFVELLQFISEKAIGNPITIDMGDLGIRNGSFPNLRKFYNSIEVSDQDLPEKIIWDGSIGFKETWYLSGGPEPYHDSFTFSIFSQKAVYSVIEDSILQFIEDRGWLCSGWITSECGEFKENKSRHGTA